MALTTLISHLDMRSNGSPQLQGFNVTLVDLVTTADIKTHALEMRLSDQWFKGDFSWSLGINLSKDKAHELEYIDATNSGALFAVLNVIPGVTGPVTDEVTLDGKPNILQRAVFLNTDTQLTDHLALNLGARYTQNKQHFTFCGSEPTTRQCGRYRAWTEQSHNAA